MNFKKIWKLLKQAVKEWQQDKVPILAAALAYYMVFSVAPMVIIVIAVLGFIVGESVARQEVIQQMEALIGPEATETVRNVIQNQFKPSSNIIATVVATLTVIFGATTVVVQLKQALNMIWDVAVKPGQGVKGFIKTRILSILMVLGIGLILLLSLISSAILAGVNQTLEQYVPVPSIVWSLADNLISVILMTLLFGQIYRVLPDVEISWKDVVVGSVITAMLFTLGKAGISIYLGNSSVGSAYGAAGSLVIFLMWVFYSAQIFLFGAEVTKVWARTYGSKIRPSENAVPESQINNL
ncbi:MAG: YihY/virulence factor BrkB family protein [Microcoleaceae cyanobacterium]